MALTETEIQTRIDTLRRAMASGILTVRHGNTTTTWRSIEELQSVIDSLQAQLNAATGTGRSRVNYIVQNTKDL